MEDYFECPHCSNEYHLSDLVKDDDTHSLDCPNCGTPIIEGYHGE